MPTIDHLNADAKALADARGELQRLVAALKAGLEALQDDRMDEIRAAIDVATGCWQALERSVAENPHLFVKPRKLSAHGILFGFEKGKGSIAVADDERTLQLIRRHLPDQAAVLINTRETVNKRAVEALPAAMLKRIGVEAIETGDRVVIRPATSELDKLMTGVVRSLIIESRERDAAEG